MEQMTGSPEECPQSRMIINIDTKTRRPSILRRDSLCHRKSSASSGYSSGSSSPDSVSSYRKHRRTVTFHQDLFKDIKFNFVEDYDDEDKVLPCFTTIFEEVLVSMPNLSCWWMQCKLKSLMSFRMVYSYLFSLTICSNLMSYNSITINGDLTITVILWLLSKLASCELNRSGCWNWNICSPVHLHLCTDPNLLISDI